MPDFVGYLEKKSEIEVKFGVVKNKRTLKVITIATALVNGMC